MTFAELEDESIEAGHLLTSAVLENRVTQRQPPQQPPCCPTCDRQAIEPGSVLHTDGRPAYREMERLG